MKSLQSLILTFLSSKERNLQLDFFRDNGQVLLQLYKQYDVNTWGIDFSSSDLDASVLELRFHKDKSNDKENNQRFVNSSLFMEFNLVEKNTYFMRISSGTDSRGIEDKILNIIKEVYNYNGEFSYTLNAY